LVSPVYPNAKEYSCSDLFLLPTLYNLKMNESLRKLLINYLLTLFRATLGRFMRAAPIKNKLLLLFLIIISFGLPILAILLLLDLS